VSAQILDGKLRALRLKERLASEIKALKDYSREVPRIVSIIVGQDPASLSYVISQQKTARELGIHYELQNFKAECSQEEVLALIGELNGYAHVHGIIVNKPLPAGMDFKVLINAIDADKDIEGLNLINCGHLFLGDSKIIPCTPSAVMELLRSSGVHLKGKRALVIGRSEIVGKPVSLLLLKEDMTVIVCHSKTNDLPGEVGRADVVVAALGRPGFVKGEWIKNGAIVIDVGINQVDGKIVGDVDFSSAKEKAAYISPVPGGVGPLTSVMLMHNALEAFKIQHPV
jgi:methylenetetrahydrofolate dehydrogenase (NADP+)/methenyltetrahydrofolate cyclohydrolase